MKNVNFAFVRVSFTYGGGCGVEELVNNACSLEADVEEEATETIAIDSPSHLIIYVLHAHKHFVYI